MADEKGFSKDKIIKGSAALAAALVAAIFGGKTLLSDDKADETVKQSPAAVVTEAPNETDAPADEKPAETEAPKTEAPQTEAPETEAPAEPKIEYVNYTFYSDELLESHFDKHGYEFGYEFGYDTPEDYEKGASDVINDPDALYKTEKEDGDGVYYIPETNEFVVLSTSGYIRTYFRPTDGIDYFERQ